MPKRNNDPAHVLTDEELEKLEKRISTIYANARDDMSAKVTEYFSYYRKREDHQRELLEAGTITEEQFKQWRLAQMGRGERFEAIRDQLAERMTKANEVAAAYINDATPGIYSLNRNYAAYTIEKQAGNIGFNLMDERTVKRLLIQQPDLMPFYPPERAVARGIDLAWGKSQITKQVTSGILQGESIKQLSDRLQNNIPDMNRVSAIRAARTSVTGAQNAGRIDSYEAAKGMGIELEKEWLATLDGRTRHSHAMLDGKHVPTDEEFSNGCMFPGDPDGPPEEVYNCFIGETKVASDSKIVRSYKHEYKGELISVKTAGGVNFTCTPNHPILTTSGWVAANLLNNGDNLLVTFRSWHGATPGINPNVNHTFPSFNAIHEFFNIFGSKRTCTLGVNFHGDRPTSDVEIITQKWFLRINGDSSARKRVNKFLFKFSDESLMGKSAAMEHFRSICLSAFSVISRKCKALSFVFSGLRHSDVHGFRTISRSNFSVTQNTIDDLAAKSEALSEFLGGFTGEIAIDKIISIEVVPSWSSTTHVYNLQTENGYYFVNSSIPQGELKSNGIFAIAKNCRCTMIARLPDVDTSDAQRRARDPETGESVLIEDMTYEEWAGWKKDTNQVETPENSGIIEVTNNLYQPVSNKREAEDYLRNELGIAKVKTTGISLEALNEINSSLTDIIQEYPQLSGVIQQVNVSKAQNSAVAAFTATFDKGAVFTSLTLGVNDLANLNSISEMIRENVDLGFWTPKNGVDGIIRHEMGHALAFMQTFIEEGIDPFSTSVNGYVDRYKAIMDFKNGAVEERVISQALSNLRMRPMQWVNLSDYGATSYAEAFAEAISDASDNPLSNEIKRIAKGGFK